MKVLISCEHSGVVRDAFLARGHDAMSCDLLPTDRPGPHYQGDVMDILDDGWDLMVAHPTCTYLANSGVRWLHTEPGRRELMEDGCTFFLALLNANIPLIAVENPIPHKYAVERIGRYTQIVQPWMFGHPETKATCLWLKGLPKLMETNNVRTEMMALPANQRGRIHHLPPSPDRWKLRSTTFQGIGEAMAEQWGGE